MMMSFLSFIQIETFLSQIDFCFFNKNYNLYIQHNVILRLKLQTFRVLGTLEVH